RRHEADRHDDAERGRRVSRSRRSGRGPPRRVRPWRLGRAVRPPGGLALHHLGVRARGWPAARAQDLGHLGAYWPHHDRGDPVSHGINVLPKYVPSTTLTDPTWQNTHVISGDVEAAVRELKAQPGR